MMMHSCDTVLTVEPLGGPLLGGTMNLNFGGDVTRGRRVVTVDYPAAPTPASIPKGVDALSKALAQQSSPVLVFAHSQGAQVCSRWLRERGDVDPAMVEFLFIGNPLRRFGGYGVGRKEFDRRIGQATPDDTAYTVTDATLQYDGWSDAPTIKNMWAKRNAARDRTGINGKKAIHAMGYRSADLGAVDRKTFRQGNTLYVLLPHKPLICAPQAWIEKGYNRPER